MESFVHKFLRHSSHYAVGEILVFAFGFISFPILTRVLSPSDYGIMSVFSVTLWIFLAFSRAGLAETTVRFYQPYTAAQDPLQRSTYYSTLSAATLVFALGVILIILLFGEWILTLVFDQHLPHYHLLMAGLVATGTLTARMMNFMRAEQRTKAYNLTLVIGRFLSLVTSLSFLFLIAKKLEIYFTGNLIAEMAITTVLVTLFYRKTKPNWNHISGSLFKECIRFGFPLVGYELGFLLLKSVDRYILQMILGPEAVGFFSVASNLGHYVKELILYPLGYAFMPIYMQIWHEQGKEATSKFVSTVANYSLLVVVPIFFLFLLLGDEVIIFLASAKYAPASKLLGWIVAGTIINALLPIYSAGLMIAKKTKVINLFLVVCVGLNVGLNLWLIPRFGLLGSCYASMITYSAFALAMAKASATYLPIHLDYRTVGIGVAASLVMYAIGTLFASSSSLGNILFRSIIACSVYCLLLVGLHQPTRRAARILLDKGRKVVLRQSADDKKNTVRHHD